jgi:hypothetical protein
MGYAVRVWRIVLLGVFFSNARGMLRITADAIEYKGFREKDSLVVSLSEVIRIEKKWAVVFPSYRIFTRDGRRVTFLAEATAFAKLLNGNKEWRP